MVPLAPPDSESYPPTSASQLSQMHSYLYYFLVYSYMQNYILYYMFNLFVHLQMPQESVFILMAQHTKSMLALSCSCIA